MAAADGQQIRKVRYAIAMTAGDETTLVIRLTHILKRALRALGIFVPCERFATRSYPHPHGSRGRLSASCRFTVPPTTFVSAFFFDRYRFASDHAFVTNDVPLVTGPVHRNLFTRTHMDSDPPKRQVSSISILGTCVSALPRGFLGRRPIVFDGLALSWPWRVLQACAQADQRDNHRCGRRNRTACAPAAHLRRKHATANKPNAVAPERPRIMSRRASLTGWNTGAQRSAGRATASTMVGQNGTGSTVSLLAKSWSFTNE